MIGIWIATRVIGVLRFAFLKSFCARLVGCGLLSLVLSSAVFGQSSPLTVQPSTGRVGVGNTNPQYPLDVTGTVNATSFRGDGSQLTNVVAGGGLLNKVTTDVTILGNSTTQTTLYSFSVPGGTLDTSNTLRLTLWGKITHTAGSGRMTFRIKYGGTTLSSGLAIDWGTTGSNQAWHVVINLSADGATNAQIMHAVGAVEWIPPSSEESSLTWYNNNGNTARVVRGTATTDSAAAQDLMVTGQWNINVGSSNSVTIEYAMLEKLS